MARVVHPGRRPSRRTLVALVSALLAATLTCCGSSTSATSTPTPSPSCSQADVLDTWSIQLLAEQIVVVPVDEGAIGTITSEVAAGAGGVILFGSAAPADLPTQLESLVASAPQRIAPFVMTDEEGGDVQRMANIVGSIPSAREMGATMSPAEIRALAEAAAMRMRAAGVTMDLAPVLDTDNGPGPNNSDADGTRSFSNDPAVASSDGRAFASGLEAGGVVPVVKHFPGLGHATGNTDVTPAATLSWSDLQTDGLIPFRDAVAAHLPVVMVSNAMVPGLSAIPASVSPAAIGMVLRGQMGFHGLVITDSLSASALQAAGYSVPQAAVAALVSGADMVLFSAQAAQVAALTSNTVNAITSAVDSGTIAKSRLVDAAGHVLEVKGVNLCAK